MLGTGLQRFLCTLLGEKMLRDIPVIDDNHDSMETRYQQMIRDNAHRRGHQRLASFDAHHDGTARLLFGSSRELSKNSSSESLSSLLQGMASNIYQRDDMSSPTGVQHHCVCHPSLDERLMLLADTYFTKAATTHYQRRRDNAGFSTRVMNSTISRSRSKCRWQSNESACPSKPRRTLDIETLENSLSGRDDTSESKLLPFISENGDIVSLSSVESVDESMSDSGTPRIANKSLSVHPSFKHNHDGSQSRLDSLKQMALIL
jgi:hypothetical protein